MTNTIAELLDDQELMNVPFEAFLSPVSSEEDKQFRAALFDCLGKNKTMGRFLRIYRYLRVDHNCDQSDILDVAREFFRANQGRIERFVCTIKEMGRQGLRRYLGLPYDGEEEDKKNKEKIGVDPSIADELEDDVVVKLGRAWMDFKRPGNIVSIPYGKARLFLSEEHVFHAWLASHGQEIIEQHKALQDAQKPVRWLTI